MVKRQVAVAEVITFLRDFYPIAASVFIHPRQTSVGVRLPRINHVHHILRLADLAKVLDFIIRRVEIYMVYLHRWKTAVMPSPDGCVVIYKSYHTKILKSKIN